MPAITQALDDYPVRGDLTPLGAREKGVPADLTPLGARGKGVPADTVQRRSGTSSTPNRKPWKWQQKCVFQKPGNKRQGRAETGVGEGRGRPFSGRVDALKLKHTKLKIDYTT